MTRLVAALVLVCLGPWARAEPAHDLPFTTVVSDRGRVWERVWNVAGVNAFVAKQSEWFLCGTDLSHATWPLFVSLEVEGDVLVTDVLNRVYVRPRSQLEAPPDVVEVRLVDDDGVLVASQRARVDELVAFELARRRLLARLDRLHRATCVARACVARRVAPE